MHSTRAHAAITRGLVLSVLCAVAFSTAAVAQGVTRLPLVYQLPGMDNVTVKKDLVYKTDGEARLTVDVYYPSQLDKSAKLPLVIFNNGVGALEIPQWRVYQDWARLVALSGMIAVNYQSRQGAAFKDTNDLIDYLRTNAGTLQIDADRIGIWTCSGNVSVGLPLAMQGNRPYIRCAVVYYGMADVSVSRQTLPLLVVRAGQDARGLNRAIDEFVQNALTSDLNFQFINYLEGQHAFDIVDDNDRSRQIIKQTLEFLQANLTAKPGATPAAVLTSTTFYDMLMRGQSDSALAHYKQARKTFKGHPSYHWVMNEGGINAMGYELLQEQRSEAALEVLKINVENHPNSPNVHDSLGDGYEAIGDTARAIDAAEKALALLQNDTSTNEDFRRAIRESAEGKLQRLKQR